MRNELYIWFNSLFCFYDAFKFNVWMTEFHDWKDPYTSIIRHSNTAHFTSRETEHSSKMRTMHDSALRVYGGLLTSFSIYNSVEWGKNSLHEKFNQISHTETLIPYKYAIYLLSILYGEFNSTFISTAFTFFHSISNSSGIQI